MRQPYANMYALYPDASHRSTSVKAFIAWLVNQGETFSDAFRPAGAFAANPQSTH